MQNENTDFMSKELKTINNSLKLINEDNSNLIEKHKSEFQNLRNQSYIIVIILIGLAVLLFYNDIINFA